MPRTGIISQLNILFLLIKIVCVGHWGWQGSHLGTDTGTVNQIPPDDGLSRRGSDVSEAF